MEWQHHSGRAMFLASAGLASTGPPDAITGVMACATLGLTASVVVILRVPQWRASVLPCVLLLMLPAGMLLWSMYARVTGLSAASRAAICALPAGHRALLAGAAASGARLWDARCSLPGAAGPPLDLLCHCLQLAWGDMKVISPI